MKSVIYGLINGIVIVCMLTLLAMVLVDPASLSKTRANVFGVSVLVVGIAGGIYVGRAHARRSRQ